MILSRIKKRKQSKKEERPLDTQQSFQPSIDDDSNWSRHSLPARPSRPLPMPPSVSQPLYTQQIIDIPHIGPTRDKDTRQRLQSIVSTLSAHTLPANPSSDALDHCRADRIGSVDGMGYFSQPTRLSITTLHGGSDRKKSGISTLASMSDPSVASFTIEHAQRASLKVRKVSEGGSEEMLPPIPVGLSGMEMPYSPSDLDVRFAKPISVPTRPPSRIDFTEPFPFKSTVQPVIPASHPFSRTSWQRDSLLPYMYGAGIEPALPSSKVGTPTDQQSGNPYRNSYNGSHPPQRLPAIIHSPLLSPRTSVPDQLQNQHQRGPSQASSAGTHKRSGSTKKKHRPDSFVLAHLRSPKSTIPSPPLTRPPDHSSYNMASSVMGLKSANISAIDRYSSPTTPTSGSKNECPKTPRTATSDGCLSALSDVESAELFQAWKGFIPPAGPPAPVPAIKRGVSVRDGHELRRRPKTPRRAGTNDGDIDIEIVLITNSPKPPSQTHSSTSYQSKPIVTLTPNTAGFKASDSPSKSAHSRRSSLTPSVTSIASTSSKGKITYLSDVVKEQESRPSSMLSVASIR
jgi:hypothetical protein